MQYANDISFADTSEEFEWEQTSGGDKVKGKGKEKEKKKEKDKGHRRKSSRRAE